MALDGDRWSTSRPGRFTPRTNSVPIEKDAEWAHGYGRIIEKNNMSQMSHTRTTYINTKLQTATKTQLYDKTERVEKEIV